MSHISIPARRARLFMVAAALTMSIFLGAHPALAGSDPASGNDGAATAASASGPAATAEEVQQLRTQLDEANRKIQALTEAVEKLQSLMPTQAVAASARPVAATAPTVASQDEPPALPASQDEPLIDRLIAPKSQGGQFSGSEGLLKNDRVKIGGYVDFRFASRSIDEGFETRETVDHINPGLTDVTNFKRTSFLAPRMVLGVAAAVTDNLLFNSEIEYEFAGEEVDVEQAYLEYRVRPQFNLRGGIIVMPLGRFNLFHDSNLLDITPRPLVSTLVIPSTYSDTGIGALGEFKLGRNARLTYEGYIVNGLRSDEEGEIVRESGLPESKGFNKFFDNNPQKSVVGRLMFSPRIGVELGASGYRGKHDSQGQYDLSIWAADWKLQYHGLQVVGEYARAAVQRGAESDEELAARALLLSLPDGDYTNTFEFIDENINEPLFDSTQRSLDGFYVEARYRFQPRWLANHFAEDASIAPVFRFDQVNLDRSFPNFRFPLNMRRASFGLSIRPTEAASFNFAYHIDRKPDVFLRLPDGRPFPPYFTNLGIKGFSMGMVWAF